MSTFLELIAERHRKDAEQQRAINADLLAALKVALEWIDGDIPEDGSWGRVEMIRAAIAKAEGKS